MSAAVMVAIDAHVAENWNYTPIIAPNGDASGPDDGSAWLEVQYPVASERMLTTGDPGNNYWREEGGVRVVLMVPLGIGLNDPAAPWMTRIDELRAALRGKKISDIVTYEASPAIIGDTNESGGHFELSFTVEYQYDVTG